MPDDLAASAPNILLLMADQFRADAMGCAGNPHIRTPGLDRLAREGVRFANGYTPVPVCVAARYSLLTGQRCAAHGRSGNNAPHPEPLLYTLPQMLGWQGYTTRSIGKMHFFPPRRHYGFQRMECQEEIPHFRENDDYLLYLKENGWGHLRQVHGVRNLLYHMPQTSPLPEEHHASTWVADRTIEFLRREGRSRSFFCWSSWIHPHPPWNPPESFSRMYRDEDMPLPDHFDRAPETLPPAMRNGQRWDGLHDASPELLRRIRVSYYACASLVDKGVARILDALDELGLAANTLVLFVADHGEMLGEHGLWQKSMPYEGAARVPFLMRFPGRVDAGRVREEPVSLLDVMPTALDLAGVRYPGERALPGASLLGAPGGGLASPRGELVIEHGRAPNRWLSLRRGNLKYNYFFNDGWEELYDLDADPGERFNLLLDDAAKHRPTAAAMQQALAEWERAHGFADSLGERQRLRNFGEAIPPREPKMNLQFPTWVKNLSPEEAAQMESWGDSTLKPIEREPTVNLQKLNLKRFKEIGGSFEGRTEQAWLGNL